MPSGVLFSSSCQASTSRWATAPRERKAAPEVVSKKTVPLGRSSASQHWPASSTHPLALQCLTKAVPAAKALEVAGESKGQVAGCVRGLQGQAFVSCRGLEAALAQGWAPGVGLLELHLGPAMEL